jgi:GAF domain-containing protein
MGQLVALSDTLNRSVTVAAVAPAIGEGALGLSGADRAAVFLGGEGAVTGAWSRGLTPGYVAEMVARLGDLPAGRLMGEGVPLARIARPGGRVIDAKTPFLIPDVGALPPETPLVPLAVSEGYRAAGIWPLTHEGHVIGFVSFYYDVPRTWSAVEEEVFLAFSLQAAVAAQNARLHDAQAQRTAQLESPPDAGKP